jgi:hypothetical protein
MSPLVSVRWRERSHRPEMRALGGHDGPREPLTDGPGACEHPRPALRIVTSEGDTVAPVLLAGADARRRASLRAEFSAALPARTTFSEANDVAEVLERAPASRMVVLAGDLDDADADASMRLLGRRHPQLPVIYVDGPMPAAAGGRG